MNGDFGFVHALVVSISFIVVSEICDKTFLIVTIMAMRHSLLIIYTASMSALITMTIVSALLGNIVTKFLPTIYTYYLSNILFAYFGIKMLKDGYYMSPNEGIDEYEEVQDEVKNVEAASDSKCEEGNYRTTNNSIKEDQRKNFTMIIRRYISSAFIRTFIMTFLAVSIGQIYHETSVVFF